MATNAIKKISHRAKQIQRAHPSKAWMACIKEASREYRAGKIGTTAVHKKTRKKTASKKAHRSAVKRHTDTKSHNVNIRVVSGIGTKNNVLKDLHNELDQIAYLQRTAVLIRAEVKKGKAHPSQFPNINYKQELKNISRQIRERKKNVSNLKRLL